ncbi:MAG TPA: hypothetical protein DHW22_02205 [Planctomycetaceae bacterium]|nr:hypothetical protein [Planctomycetaceae bacterium]
MIYPSGQLRRDCPFGPFLGASSQTHFGQAIPSGPKAPCRKLHMLYQDNDLARFATNQIELENQGFGGVG